MKHWIIGSGGVGSWLPPAMCRLVGNENVVLMDGDKLERKNLDRQLFSEHQVGQNKAEALGELYRCEWLAEWFAFGARPYEKEDWLFCCVDNNPGRMSVLQACDYHQCRAIFAANETHSAEAYVYLPEWRDTKLDPRIMYPEMAADTAGDPRAAAIGCTGEAQKENRQLVSANFMAAGLAMSLYVVWGMEAPRLPRDTWPYLPHKRLITLSGMETFKAEI